VPYSSILTTDLFCSLAWKRTLKCLSPAGVILSARLRVRLLRWHAHALHECPFCKTALEYEDATHLAVCPQFYGARRQAHSAVVACVNSLFTTPKVKWREGVMHIQTSQHTYTLAWVDDLRAPAPASATWFTWSGLWYRPPGQQTGLTTTALATIAATALNALGLYSHNPTVAQIPDGAPGPDSESASGSDTSLDLASMSDSSSCSSAG